MYNPDRVIFEVQGHNRVCFLGDFDARLGRGRVFDYDIAVSGAASGSPSRVNGFLNCVFFCSYPPFCIILMAIFIN